MLRRFALLLLLILACRGQTSDQIPTILPIQYDLQVQLPISAPHDTLIPGFFASLKVDFQISKTLFAKFRTVPQQLPSRFYHVQLQQPRLPSSGVEIRLKATALSNFENVTLEGRDRSYPIQSVETDGNELVIRITESALSQGTYSLTIGRYSGIITYDKGIFYRIAGAHPILASDLFPDHASALFPCFDTTSGKAAFQLSVIHPSNTKVLSSMHSEETGQKLSESWLLTRFAKAPSISPYNLGLAVLPSEYIVDFPISKFPIYVWVNKHLMTAEATKYVTNLTALVYAQVVQMLPIEELELQQMNMVFLDDFNETQSFGTVFIGQSSWRNADEAHRIAMLAKSMIRHWFGGVATISSRTELCFQEDIVHYLANKVVYKLLAHMPSAVESYRLSEFVRVQMAETFFAPGESLSLPPGAPKATIASHCALKGVIQLESLETVVTEDVLIAKLRATVSAHRFRTYRFENFLEHFRNEVTDGTVNIAQVLDFWRKNGGIPNLLVEKVDERVRFTQKNQFRQAQVGNYLWAPMPMWPIRLELRNLTLPVNFMVSRGLEMAPIDKHSLVLTNYDYKHLVRVNYDPTTWARIRESMAEAPSLFSQRARAQIVNDFCYFYSLGEIGPGAETIRNDFLELIRNEAESFDLCEFYAFWCIAGKKRKISLRKESRAKINALMPSVFASLTNRDGFACFDPPLGYGQASHTANALCQAVFGAECL